MSRAAWLAALAGCLLTGCDGSSLLAFEPKAIVLGGSAGRGPEGDSGTGASASAGRGGTAGAPDAGTTAGGAGGTTNNADAGTSGEGAASPLSIDDFEDGDTRAKPPLGWWYPVNDKTGAQGFGIEPVSPGTASTYALRTHGSGFRDWGSAVGLDLVGEAAPLDLQSYKELCFLSRVEAGSSTVIQVHLLRGSQHYTHDVSLSEAWTRYCLPLRDFTGLNQETLVPNELLALQFFFAPNDAFLFWLDDVEVVGD